MMPEFDPPPNDDPQSPDKANRFEGTHFEGTRFDGASVPRSHTQAAFNHWASPDAGSGPSASRKSGPNDLGQSEAVRDVSIEALLYRLDEALAAIRSLDAEVPGGDRPATDEGSSSSGDLNRDAPDA